MPRREVRPCRNGRLSRELLVPLPPRQQQDHSDNQCHRADGEKESGQANRPDQGPDHDRYSDRNHPPPTINATVKLARPVGARPGRGHLIARTMPPRLNPDVSQS
jgi:hypothetical protein